MHIFCIRMPVRVHTEKQYFVLILRASLVMLDEFKSFLKERLDWRCVQK